MFAMARPALDWQSATRFLVSAEAAAIPAAVLLNKADLVPPPETAAAVAQVSHILQNSARRDLSVCCIRAGAS